MPQRGKYLAIYNFGLHVGPYDSPAVEGFRLREAANFEAAARGHGFIGRSGYDGEAGPACWGKQVFPRFIQGSGFATAPSSLSLWADIESLMAFTYGGVHSDALKHARRWNVKPRWPALVLWWVDADVIPEWMGSSGWRGLTTRDRARPPFHSSSPMLLTVIPRRSIAAG